MHDKLLLKLSLILTTTPILAADTIAWEIYLGTIMSVSLIIAIVLSSRNKDADSRLAKILLGGLYFWVATFIQLIIFALYYHFYG